MKEVLIGDLRCLVRLPHEFSEERKYPILLFLHGAGTRGNDMDKLASNPFFSLTEEHRDFPFVCIAPLCTENTWFDLWEHLLALVQQIVKLPYADKERIYLMGASMGGYATWQLAMSLPQVFAAAVPVCGGGMYWNAGRLADVPVWAFHGGKDQTVLPEESVKMVEAVNRRGGNAKLTVYPENGHNAWSDTYSDPEVFAWLLQQKKKSESGYTDEYNDSERFG